ncbi:MAG TPA: LysR substrate-binding domain-containing protein [Burkholderiaceae bacterium]|nr:LysR substrate-binding domain-containing protein [Burkholderiaceae bacterium]
MSSTTLDPKLLRSFLVLAEELHFGNAAARLHMTQPPLSKQIAQLEELLEVRLFDRNRRGVRLTPAGATLVTEAQRLLAQANLAVEAVQRTARGDFARVRIAFNASVLFMDVEHLVTRVENALPGLQSTWEEMGSSEQTDALRQRRIDIGFAQAPHALQGLESLEVARVPMAIALPAKHRLARRSSVSIAALSDEDFVLVPRDVGPGFFDMVIAACVAAGFSPRIRHQARHLLTTLSLVATSGAVSLVPQTLARASLPGVALRPIAGTKVEASYSVMWNPANTLPVLPRVLDIFARQ